MTYELVLQIEANDLRAIQQAGLNITLVKAMGVPDVAWQSIQPAEMTRLEWTEEYGIYASRTGISPGSTIVVWNKVAPAVLGKSYNFGGQGTFSGPFNSVFEGAYAVVNQMPSYLTFGLTQSIVVNGQEKANALVNALAVPSNIPYGLGPTSTVHIWLQASMPNGTAVQEPMTKVAVATFSPRDFKRVMVYDANKGTFVPAASEKAISAPQSALS